MSPCRRVLSTSLLAGVCTLLVGGLHAQSFRTISATRLARNEQSLRVRVEFAAGMLSLKPGDSRTLYQGEIYYDEDSFDASTDYEPDRRALYFGLDNREGEFRLGRLEEPQRLDLELNPHIPIRLVLELGAVEAEIELGGMTISDLDLSTGAAETSLSFSEPNRGECRSLDLTVAAAEFHGRKLANSRCETINFEGGVGDITLDFSGDWTNATTTDAEIRLGLGQLTLRLPRNLGVALEVDRFLASFDRAGFRKRGSRYVSEGYESTTKKLTVYIKAVLGDIDIDWVGR